MQRLSTFARTAVAVAALAVSASASAAVVTWTDWTTFATSSLSATGMMGGVGVTVTASNPMNGETLIGGAANCPVNRWNEPNAGDRPYTGGTVSNAPTPCEQLGLNDAQRLVTVNFSSAVSTLYMALLSVGQGGLPVTYDFDQAFVIDSEGQGHWGNDPTDGVMGAGDTLTMEEFHGLIRFTSPVTTLNFSTNNAEFWHAFTFGAAASAAVPEPMSLGLVGAALLAAGVATRRRRS